ncbi:Gp138 family membrane-puncturing spike protein [Novacetimonas pomaceti]|uniref:Gp138 family membrane-puncturing spike protein n=1 Tax=Novacetimonas pomaceti TaxID=2021998 RepID=UPI001C2D7771|nr:Gp138 family membrane-puncturing spike protein [Novacetimonas pomaceti]MBV1833084.1 hypothetical protein [Novacetimonas pomaceti]
MTANFGFMRENDGKGSINAMLFMARQILRNECATAMIVKVLAVDATARTVDVQPMVDQVTPSGAAIPHGTLHEIPYGYVQGGNCLIQIDPVVGDIGVSVFAHRDITRVKRTRANATPQTLRAHNLADGLYVGTLWAAQSPVHKIVLAPQSGITITSSQTVTVNAATKFVGDMEVDGTISASGDVKAGSISLENHGHPVTDAPGTTGKPE